MFLIFIPLSFFKDLFLSFEADSIIISSENKYYMYVISGVISVYFEANVSSHHPQGFNASFWVRRCTEGGSEEGLDGSSECQGLAHCHDGICQCPSGFGGPLCDSAICPGDCGNREGHGICNVVTTFFYSRSRATAGFCNLQEDQWLHLDFYFSVIAYIQIQKSKS